MKLSDLIYCFFTNKSEEKLEEKLLILKDPLHYFIKGILVGHHDIQSAVDGIYKDHSDYLSNLSMDLSGAIKAEMHASTLQILKDIILAFYEESDKTVFLEKLQGVTRKIYFYYVEFLAKKANTKDPNSQRNKSNSNRIS